MTISPELFNQFNRLVDLAVVTNIMPYLLSMAAVSVIMKAAGVEPSKAKLYTFVALIGALYSFYALFSTGITEVFSRFACHVLRLDTVGLPAPRFVSDKT